MPIKPPKATYRTDNQQDAGSDCEEFAPRLLLRTVQPVCLKPAKLLVTR
jgi:hypothetical protein